MIELIIGVLLAGGAVWFVLQPIFRPGAGSAEWRAPSDDEPGDDGAEPRHCARCRAVLPVDARYCSRCGAGVTA